MGKAARIQLSRRAGFRLQERSLALNGLAAVNVARPSRFGNPFRVVQLEPATWVASADLSVRSTRHETKAGAVREAVACFRANLLRESMGYTIEEMRAALRGKNLACWCALPEPGERDWCHAAELLIEANR